MNKASKLVCLFFQANESGIVQFVKRPGAVLENGSVIAKLTLDDPAQCCQIDEYQVCFVLTLKAI